MKNHSRVLIVLLLICLMLFGACSNGSLKADNDQNKTDINAPIIGAFSDGTAGDAASQSGLSADVNSDLKSKGAEGAMDAGSASDISKIFEMDREKIVSNTQEAMKKAFAEVPDPYLIGWTFSLKVSGLADEQEKQLYLKSLFEALVVNQEFQYDVGMPLQSFDMDKGYYLTVGKTNDISNPFSSQSSVNATNTSSSVSHKGPEDIVYTNDKVVVQIASIITTSKEVSFVEFVEIEGWESVYGTLNFERLGPGSRSEQKDIDVDAEIVDGTVKASVPQGNYKLTFKRDDFVFDIVLDGNYVLLTENNKIITLEGRKNVKGKVFKGESSDDDKMPVEDAVVKLVPLMTDAGIEGDFFGTTDSNGEYSIPDVPIGAYLAFVDGIEQHIISIDKPGNGEWIAKDMYKRSASYDITLFIKMPISTVQFDFTNVYIGNEYTNAESSPKGVFNITKGGDVVPNSATIIKTECPGKLVYGDNLFRVLKTDETAGGYQKPNTYYLDYSIELNWFDGQGQPVWQENYNQGLLYGVENFYSGEVDAEAFEALLNDGIPFSLQHNVRGYGDATITIVTHEE